MHFIWGFKSPQLIIENDEIEKNTSNRPSSESFKKFYYLFNGVILLY